MVLMEEARVQVGLLAQGEHSKCVLTPPRLASKNGKKQQKKNTDFSSTFQNRYCVVCKTKYSPTHTDHLYLLFSHDSSLYTKLTDTSKTFLTVAQYM